MIRLTHCVASFRPDVDITPAQLNPDYRTRRSSTGEARCHQRGLFIPVTGWMSSAEIEEPRAAMEIAKTCT